MNCEYCKKEIKDKTNMFTTKKKVHFCNKECYKKYGLERKKLTDYIQSLYIKQGYEKNQINWVLLMSQIKNMQKDKGYKYSGVELSLRYMVKIKEVNLFSDNFNGSILNLVPFYYQESKEYWIHQRKIKQALKGVDTNIKPKTIIKTKNYTYEDINLEDIE